MTTRGDDQLAPVDAWSSADVVNVVLSNAARLRLPADRDTGLKGLYAAAFSAATTTEFDALGRSEGLKAGHRAWAVGRNAATAQGRFVGTDAAAAGSLAYMWLVQSRAGDTRRDPTWHTAPDDPDTILWEGAVIAALALALVELPAADHAAVTSIWRARSHRGDEQVGLRPDAVGASVFSADTYQRLKTQLLALGSDFPRSEDELPESTKRFSAKHIEAAAELAAKRAEEASRDGGRRGSTPRPVPRPLVGRRRQANMFGAGGDGPAAKLVDRLRDLALVDSFLHHRWSAFPPEERPSTPPFSFRFPEPPTISVDLAVHTVSASIAAELLRYGEQLRPAWGTTAAALFARCANLLQAADAAPVEHTRGSDLSSVDVAGARSHAEALDDTLQLLPEDSEVRARVERFIDADRVVAALFGSVRGTGRDAEASLAGATPEELMRAGLAIAEQHRWAFRAVPEDQVTGVEDED